ncbi:hypothetical protein [Glaciihabitans sp. dw_435]|uniref:hypothetical protein n=1 Tax=Glaciihabitans sp. dw_435 TaxID=2720081 RepID=UPI001BD5C873|nr:hypothetical protein [Glaciihabitans sp. dw_435]
MTAPSVSRTSAPRTRGWGTALAGRPAWVIVLGIYLASRIFSTAVLLSSYAMVGDRPWPVASSPTHRDFFRFSAVWDGTYYRHIAVDGYPATLPLDGNGFVNPNAWAFLPVFPWLTRGVMTVTGLGFDPAGVLVAVVFGAVAALALFRLLQPRTGRTPALWAVTLFCFGPMAFVLQLAYAESIFLALLFCGLVALVRRHYLALLLFGVVASFTRPGALALAVALGVHVIIRLRSAEPFPVAARVRAVAAGVGIVLAGLAWPVIAGLATGQPDAYLQTEMAWWAKLIDRGGFVPLSPWFLLAGRYLGVLGIILVIAIAAAFVWFVSRRSTRTIGPDALAFTSSYALYIFAVFLPQQSVFRIFLPLAPLLGSPVFTGGRRRRWIWLAGCLVLQPLAVGVLWFSSFP